MSQTNKLDDHSVVAFSMEFKGGSRNVLLVTTNGIYYRWAFDPLINSHWERTYFLRGSDTNSPKVHLEYLMALTGPPATSNSICVKMVMDRGTGKALSMSLDQSARLFKSSFETIAQAVVVESNLVTNGIEKELLRHKPVRDILGLRDRVAIPEGINFFTQLTNRIVAFSAALSDRDVKFAFLEKGVYMQTVGYPSGQPIEFYFLGFPVKEQAQASLNHGLGSIFYAQFPSSDNEVPGCVRNIISMDSDTFERERFRYDHLNELNLVTYELFLLLNRSELKIDALPEEIARLKGIKNLFRGLK